MSLVQSPIIGTIRIEPLADQAEPWASDDSTLEQALASYARQGELADQPELTIVASRRLSCLRPRGETALDVRANLAQLLDDLQAEYEQLASRI